MSFFFVDATVETRAMVRNRRRIEAIKFRVFYEKDPAKKYLLQCELEYTPHEALIESVEEGRNDIKYFVERYGFKLLYKKDRANHNKNILEIAQDAENFSAVGTIRTLMTKHPFEKINKKTISTK